MSRQRLVKGLGVGIAMLVVAAGTSCAGPPRSEKSVTSTVRVLKVAVFANGRITADGSTTTIEALRETLKRLAGEKGEVWCYREAAQAEPTPQAMEVIKAVVEHQLPIRLSTKPDYSDAVGMDGRPVRK